MRTQNDHIVLRFLRHGERTLQDHSLHTQEKGKADREEQDHAQTDREGKILKKADLKQPSGQQKACGQKQPDEVENCSKAAVNKQQYKINKTENSGNSAEDKHRQLLSFVKQIICY